MIMTNIFHFLLLLSTVRPNQFYGAIIIYKTDAATVAYAAQRAMHSYCRLYAPL